MQQPTKKTRKISTQEAQERAIDSAFKGMNIPDDARGYIAYRLLKGVGSLPRQSFVTCPVCGGRMPAEFRHGQRTCRNCCHYELESATAERRSAIEADSRRWMEIHHKPTLVAA